MSDSGKAVFLSYASQDTEAAKRICEALRATGVEVWFDQSELVGGDAWDQKIRKQIKDCALLIPIISANTQSRTEGYFRLEWRLADQRTHLMAKGRAFLLPVVIDDTRDTEAHVPDSFTEVQWTRLRQGYGGQAMDEAALAAFCARVQKLLGGSDVEPGRPRPGNETRGGVAAPPKKKPLWLVPVILAAVFAGLWQQRRNSEKAPVATLPAVVSAASTELARIRARIIPDRWQKGDFEVVSATLDRIIQNHPEDADAYALRSIIHSLQVVRLIDPGTQLLEAGRAAADRALRISPEAPLAHLARGLHLVAMVSRGGDPTACRIHLDQALAALPPDTLTRYVELVSYWLGYDFEGTERSARAWQAADPSASFPAWILVSKGLATRRPDEAERWAQVSINDPNITGIRTLLNLAEVHFYLKAEPAGSRAMLDRIPLQSRSIARVVYARWLQAMVEQRWDAALQELAQVTDPMLLDLAYNGPKALLAALAHQRAGRAEVATVQFREAERLLREKLAADSDNEALRVVLAVALAGAGRPAEARSELALVEPLVRERAPNVYRARLVVAIAQTHGILGDHAAMAAWIRKLFAEPSNVPFTPASFRLDPRFNGAIDAPEIQELLKEFAHLDQPVAVPKSQTQDSGPPSPPAADSKSIAVLPFANLSPDPENAFFCDGVHDDVITVLAKIRDLRVISRTSMLAYRDPAARNVKKIAADLGVANVLEGSVRRAGNKVRVSAQLIDARTDAHLWAETYDGELTDIFALQAKLAQQIAGALQATLTGSELALIERRPTENQEAYDLFLRARAMQQEQGEFGTVADFERIVTVYDQAIAKDPAFALAHAQVAQVHSILYWFGFLDPSPARAERMKAAVAAAARLAPDAPETHVALGSYHYRVNLDWNRALASFRLAETGLPNDPQLQFWLAITYRRLGRWAESADFFARSVALNPRDLSAVSNHTLYLSVLRRWALGRTATDKALTYFPTRRELLQNSARIAFALDGDATAYARAVEQLPPSEFDPAGATDKFQAALLRRNLDAARQALEGLGSGKMLEWYGNVISDPVTFHQSYVAYLRGDREEAKRLAEQAIAHYRGERWNTRQQPWVQMRIAQLEAWAGRADEALRDGQAALSVMRPQDALGGAQLLEKFGTVLVSLNRRDEALARLREVLAGPCTMSPNEFRVDLLWSRLKDDPRFEEILQSAKPL